MSECDAMMLATNQSQRPKPATTKQELGLSAKSIADRKFRGRAGVSPDAPGFMCVLIRQKFSHPSTLSEYSELLQESDYC
jgi:hypothetical protein